jgi:hypothetical protein
VLVDENWRKGKKEVQKNHKTSKYKESSIDAEETTHLKARIFTLRSNFVSICRMITQVYFIFSEKNVGREIPDIPYIWAS